MTEYRYKLTIEPSVPYLPTPVIYSPESFGFAQFKGLTGEGVRVCIIDSGVPDHESIPNIVDSANFTESDDEKDTIGHASLIAGLIGANRDDCMVGIAPRSLLYFSKMVGDDARVRFDAFVAAVLWGVIKEVDIIVILFSTDIHHPALHDAIKKAYDAGICIIATAEKNTYPAKYPEVLSFGPAGLPLPSGPLYSTYTDHSYAKASGLSISTAIGAGLCALTIGQKMSEKLHFKPAEIYEHIKEVINGNTTGKADPTKGGAV